MERKPIPEDISEAIKHARGEAKAPNPHNVKPNSELVYKRRAVDEHQNRNRDSELDKLLGWE